jgi:hypothetical protein
MASSPGELPEPAAEIVALLRRRDDLGVVQEPEHPRPQGVTVGDGQLDVDGPVRMAGDHGVGADRRLGPRRLIGIDPDAHRHLRTVPQPPGGRRGGGAPVGSLEGAGVALGRHGPLDPVHAVDPLATAVVVVAGQVPLAPSV